MAQRSRKAGAEPTRKSQTGWLIGAMAALAIGGAAIYFATLGGPSPAPETGASETSAAPILSRHIYSETADPRADIAAALKEAREQNKRVLLDFGGDWCADCQVLDIYLHQPPNSDLLARNFVLVHVWIGNMDQHVDIAAKYGIPLSKGVPALAVLAPDGKVLYAQTAGEFDDMRQMNPGSVTQFLSTWKS